MNEKPIWIVIVLGFAGVACVPDSKQARVQQQTKFTGQQESRGGGLMLPPLPSLDPLPRLPVHSRHLDGNLQDISARQERELQHRQQLWQQEMHHRQRLWQEQQRMQQEELHHIERTIRGSGW